MEAREKLLFKTNFPAELWGGQVIDKRYKILKFLNKGHRSYIYLAQNEIEEKPVVIRIIYHSALSFYIQRVINEAKKTIRQNLYHPNILQITDVGLAKLGDDNYCFIIQEFIELQTLMEIQSKITTELAVGVILTLCEVLDYLHKQNIIYGKLKSNSVLLASKIVPFTANWPVIKSFIICIVDIIISTIKLKVALKATPISPTVFHNK